MPFQLRRSRKQKKKSFTFYLLQLSRTRCSTHATSMPYYLWLIFLLFNCIYSSQLSRVFGQRVNKRHTRVKLRSVFFLLSSPSRIYALCLFNREPLITFYAFNKKQKHWICISHGCNLCLRMPQPSTLDAFFFFAVFRTPIINIFCGEWLLCHHRTGIY